MASKKLTRPRRKSQPRITITSHPDGFERLLELAEKRGYSERALAALLLSAVAAKANRRHAQRRRKAVRRA